MILFYLIPLYLSNAIPLENDNAGAVNVMLNRTNLGSRGRDRLHDPVQKILFGSKEKRHEEQGACEDTLTACAGLRQESNINPQGLDYCFVDGYVDRMREICIKTCGYCDTPELPECAKTQWGCCWDKKTIKLTSDGSNCPNCFDHYANACYTFRDDCSSRYKPGEFMHTYCPATCELCDGKCMDERGYGDERCPFWKTEYGWCDSKDKHFEMRFFCPATCELC